LHWYDSVKGQDFFARWRVRLGYPVAVLVLVFARPTPRSIVGGAIVGTLGLWIRAAAAGHLHKQEVLTASGPYAYTRNPLYFGSAILVAGAAIAANSWISAVILCTYFAIFYSVVMKREEQELRMRHGAHFDEYARAVPLFIPHLVPAKLFASSAGRFSLSQYKKNREYRAAIGFLLVLTALVVIWHLRLR
jgi:protein-S-isoprenylcysteine O-methyltransferase Ste14